MKTKTANWTCGALLLWGFTAMTGELTGIAGLKGLGLASGTAPYTKVFCEAVAADDGQRFETFAADFTLSYQTSDGGRHSVAITPAIYQRIRGPYNRRNVYGAVLAYGPALPPDLRAATFRYALVEPGAVARELGLPPDARDFEVMIRSRTAGKDDVRVLGGK